MSDQLWYTSSATGLGQSRGWQVRAASLRLHSQIAAINEDLTTYFRYNPPDGGDSYNTPKFGGPIDLALINGGDRFGRVLLRKVFVGFGDDGRPGIFFTHALLNLPKDFAAKRAIGLWQAKELWKQSAEELPSDQFVLPEIDGSLLVQDSIDQDFLTSNCNVDQLTFILQAYLRSKRIYICAPNNCTAALIWGLTASLPEPLTGKITFSTYGYDGSINSATDRTLIVGTSRHSTREKVELPEACFSGGSAALNCYTTRKSPLGEDKRDLAAYLAKLRYENPEELRQFLTLAKKRRVETLETLTNFFVEWNTEPKDFKADVVSRLLSDPTAASYYLCRPEFQDRVLDLTLKGSWWEFGGKRLIENLRARAASGKDVELIPALDGLVDRAFERLVDELKKGDAKNIKRLVSELAASACPKDEPREQKVWCELLELLDNPVGLQWEVRSNLLVAAGRYFPPEQLERCFDRSLNELNRILELDIDDDTKARASLLFLNNALNGSASDNLSSALVKHKQIFNKAIEGVPQDKKSEFIEKLYPLLLRANYPDIPQLAQNLLKWQIFDADLMLSILQSAGTVGVDGYTMLRTNSWREYISKMPAPKDVEALEKSVAPIIAKFLGSLTIDNCAETENSDALSWLATGGGIYLTIASAWNVIAEFSKAVTRATSGAASTTGGQQTAIVSEDALNNFLMAVNNLIALGRYGNTNTPITDDTYRWLSDAITDHTQFDNVTQWLSNQREHTDRKTLPQLLLVADVGKRYREQKPGLRRDKLSGKFVDFVRFAIYFDDKKWLRKPKDEVVRQIIALKCSDELLLYLDNEVFRDDKWSDSRVLWFIASQRARPSAIGAIPPSSSEDIKDVSRATKKVPIRVITEKDRVRPNPAGPPVTQQDRSNYGEFFADIRYPGDKPRKGTNADPGQEDSSDETNPKETNTADHRSSAKVGIVPLVLIVIAIVCVVLLIFLIFLQLDSSSVLLGMISAPAIGPISILGLSLISIVGIGIISIVGLGIYFTFKHLN